jgi:hypothetical protein
VSVKLRQFDQRPWLQIDRAVVVRVAWSGGRQHSTPPRLDPSTWQLVISTGGSMLGGAIGSSAARQAHAKDQGVTWVADKLGL